MVIPAFINPDAGSASRFVALLAEDPRFALRSLPAGGLARAVAVEVGRGTTRVLVAGGDGTVATAAGVLAGTGVELAVLPGGTLNHFARDAGLPEAPGEAIDVAAGRATRRVDVGYLNGRLFLNTSSIGAYVELARIRDRLRPRVGYFPAVLLGTAWAFLQLRSHRVRVHTEHGEEEHRTPLLFVGVGERDVGFSRFGGRATDGRGGLHLIVIEGRARRHLLALSAASLLRGVWAMARSPRLTSALVQDCRVELADGPVEVALDGEIHRVELPLRYRLGREELTLVVAD